MTLARDRAQQMAEAESLLADRPHSESFAQRLFFGECQSSLLAPYPRFAGDTRLAELLARVQAFCRQEVDPVAIDRRAEIPAAVVRGLGKLGVLGACLPKSCGGLGLSQSQYCRLIEVLGAHCASTALFVNAHHSIGPRALVLFGTAEQQRTWLPKLATGEWISAFALTEPEAGSDAANVQTRAEPTPDGGAFLLTGEKRWITNGGIAQVLTVMARTPGPRGGGISAFLVTPDMAGFEVVERRMEKLGVRGTATSRLAFHGMRVPRANMLGPLGKGLKVALTVLDYGRTTFGASCAGAARFCVAAATRHALSRRQFQQPLAAFEMVKEKLARMQAESYAMEACTLQTAAIMDANTSEYMLETAMLKVFATETLWRIIHDTFQLHGGLAYFNDQPFERLLRDHRIDLIGEGANDVLRAFIALVGMRSVGLDLQAVLLQLQNPFQGVGHIAGFAGRRLGRMVTAPVLETGCPELEEAASRLGRLVGQLAGAVERLLAEHREEIVDRQYQLGRIADAAIDIYVSHCVLRRAASELVASDLPPPEHDFQLATARYFLILANRRAQAALASLWSNDDRSTTDLANALLIRAARQ